MFSALILKALGWAYSFAWIGGSAGLASWVQAIGSIGAIFGAVWIALHGSAEQRRRDAAARNAVATAAYIMVMSLKNQALKARQSLENPETAIFWALEGGKFATELHEQMANFPAYSAGEASVLGAFENARSMVSILLKLHASFALAAEELDKHQELVLAISESLSAIEERSGQDAKVIARYLTTIPLSREQLFPG